VEVVISEEFRFDCGSLNNQIFGEVFRLKRTILVVLLVCMLVSSFSLVALAQEKIVLRVSWWGSQGRHDRTLAVIELFEQKYPHITIEPEFAGWDNYWERIAAQAAGRNLPDVFQQDMQYLDLYSSRNMLADLQPYVDSGAIDTTYISEAELSGGRLNGKLYGINLGSNALVGIYDPEIFAKAGVEVPGPEWTWDDYIEIGKTIKEKTGLYWATQFPGNFFHAFHHVLRQNGYQFYDGPKLGYDDDKLLADFLALELELIEQGIFAPYALREEVSSVEDDLLVKGQAATAWAWSNQIVAMSAAANRPLGLITLPKAKDQVKEGLYIKPSMFFSVAETSPHKEAAVLFIDFFTNDIEANKILFAERGVPISSKVREALEPDLTEAQILMFDYLNLIGDHTSPIDPPEPAGHPEVNRALDDIDSMVLHGVISPEEGAKRFRQEATRILRSM